MRSKRSTAPLAGSRSSITETAFFPSDAAGFLLLVFFIVSILTLQSCNSPFQVKQDYTPQLVVYGIAFRGDSTLVIRVDTKTETSAGGSTAAGPIAGLAGTVANNTTGQAAILKAEYVGGVNLLEGTVDLAQKTNLTLSVVAPDYPACSSSLTVLDSAIIYLEYYTTEVLRSPSAGDQNPRFTIYPSRLTRAIRVWISLKYEGVDSEGDSVSGSVFVKPAYQQDTTSYFLRINGQATDVNFNLSDYSTAFAEAHTKIVTGHITAVLEVLQTDAAIYDFYSISNGFNDPLTMRTERPVYTNISGGLGFFGSAAYDSTSIRVFP